MLANFKKNQKKNTGKRFLTYLGAFFAFFILVILIINNIKIYHKRQEFLAQVESLKTQIKNIEEKNSNIKQATSKTNDSAYIEKVAREELDLQKPGEKAVSFVMPEGKPTNDENQPKNNLRAWFKALWDRIMGKK